MPICPDNVINGIDISNISVKNSATKPILIPINCDNEFKILFKNEDLRKDHIVINIIKLMNIFLKNEGLDLKIVEYDIFAYNSKCGYVEIVNDSDTIYNITEIKNFSIQNFILENNDSEQIDVIKDNFVKSCAAYCVISYLLGFGDRHLDNIMITKKGFLFHIDFSFILGKDPKLIASEIRITNDMIDVMGGMNSKYYKKFKDICNKSFNCLRKHSSLFEILLSFVYLYKPIIDNGIYSKEVVYNHIVKRFIPDETEDEAIIHIESKMSNRSTYSEQVIDFFHHAAKKNSEEGYLKKMLNIF
jgi:phosphatidylinositol kinase/protein kinase (PI-3  family)